MQHEALLVAFGQRVDGLLVVGAAERRRDQRLRLAAREERDAVGARDDPQLAGDRADVGGAAAVDAHAVARMRSRTTSERRSCSVFLVCATSLLELAAPRLDGLEAVEAGGARLNSVAIVSTTADSTTAIAA